MNRIDATFQKLQEQGRKALIPFVTAGDAGLDTTPIPSRKGRSSRKPASAPWRMGRNWLIFSIWSNACGKRRRFPSC